MSLKNINAKKVFLKKLLQKAKNCDIITIREPTEPSVCEKNTEEYRSGHNGPDSKSGIQKCIVGSNPTSSAKNPARKRGIFPFSLFTIHSSLFTFPFSLAQNFWQVRSKSE